MTRAGLGEQAADGEGADALLCLGGRAGGGRQGGSTSTGPLAITAASWVVLTTSTVTMDGPSVSSLRLPVTVPSRRVRSPSNGGNRYWICEWRRYPSGPAHAAT